MEGSVLKVKSSLKMLELYFSSNLGRGSYIASIGKTASQKIGALIRSLKFLSSMFFFIATHSPTHSPTTHLKMNITVNLLFS